MKTKRSISALLVLTFALLACHSPLTALQTAPTIDPNSTTNGGNTLPIVIDGEVNPAAQQEALVTLYENASKGTVAIITNTGQGSGFVFDELGHIVTNFHVIEGARDVEVRFVSGFMAYGTVIGTDTDSDLAVVKVDPVAGELFPQPLGDSTQLKVGQTVVAIGNPFGLESTMTVGIISALTRTLESAHASPEGAFFTAGDIIQTDAAINPGNSGGPLFNIKGEVVGVNRAIRTTSVNDAGQPVNSGIGFAISSNMVKRVVPYLIRDGKYDYPYIGISSNDLLTLQMVNALGLKQYTGAYVTSVAPGGPADQAGIKAGADRTNIPGIFGGGDLITGIDGKNIRSFDELLAYLITSKGPGDVITLTILRGDETLDIPITLGRRP